ncbi:MAG TPA: RidA family protein [Actinomycetota bacterium]|nr:RidA family protein [Actinomycetota bacterium]
MVENIEDRLASLKIELPPAPPPVASYVPVRIVGDLAHLSGQIAMVDGEPIHRGRVGGDVSLEQGQEAARRCVLQALAALRDVAGSLDRVEAIVQLSVFVASEDGFNDQPKVANGASDLLVEIFGDAGRHARVAVGVGELPLGAPVEVGMVVHLMPR